jgi:hypothetical protein
MILLLCKETGSQPRVDGAIGGSGWDDHWVVVMSGRAKKFLVHFTFQP